MFVLYWGSNAETALVFKHISVFDIYFAVHICLNTCFGEGDNRGRGHSPVHRDSGVAIENTMTDNRYLTIQATRAGKRILIKLARRFKDVRKKDKRRNKQIDTRN